MRSASRWKAHERTVAERLGTVRLLHRDGRAGADVRIPGYDIQIKTKASLPKWWTGAWAQAVRDCEEGQEPALVVVYAPGPGIKARRWVVLDFEHFVQEQYPHQDAFWRLQDDAGQAE